MKLGNWEFKFLDNGDYIYKASPIKSKKPSEQPIFKVCLKIEDSYHKIYNQSLKAIVKDISNFLLK